MATRGPNEPPPRPQVGDTLIVIHDFLARSSDELSLSKGDRVELIERDDEFGDGWFLGRHILNDNTGLFPEVYTRPAPKNVSVLAPPRLLSSTQETKNAAQDTGIASAPTASPLSPQPSSAQPIGKEGTSTSLPLQPVKPDIPAATSSTTASSSPASQLRSARNPSHDSQVLNDTLNVINEHITHLRGSPSSGGLLVPAGANDSGSEYSMPLDQRMSYIQGEETDEEEDQEHSRAEVESWDADQVAEHLFTVGVEKQHCEVFRDQEISGEVLLGMDQSSLFIKAFDLGSVGRRLKTWHKIKALQDEVDEPGPSTRRTTRTWGSDVGSSEDAKGTRARTSATTVASVSKLFAPQGSSAQTPQVSPTTTRFGLSTSGSLDTPTRSNHVKRPSAASVRDLHQSRRHSSIDYRAPAPPFAGALAAATPPAAALLPNGTATRVDSAPPSHKKQASFDRNWTLGNALGHQPPRSRPLSSAGLQDARNGSNPDLQDSAVDLDRGYFSGAETDGRRRNVLKKRDSRTSSYADEQRVRSATALSRHSRFGSMDSYRDASTSPAAQKYYGLQSTPHRRTASAKTAESARPSPPTTDSPAPIVTRIDAGLNPTRSAASPMTTTSSARQGFAPDWLAAVVNKPMSKGRPGMRAISDKLSRNSSKDMASGDGALDSPGGATPSTASGEPSLDVVDSPATGKSFNSMTSKSNKKKGKKDTSAFTRGLLKATPLEAKQGADYYGWMKKKSSNLMTTWKPRLFVLKGRRLAYYYAEDDDQEKGLIDISFHRVLPAGNERLTGLHATLTGAAGGGPGGPGGPSHGGSDASGGAGGAGVAADKGSESVFIFKLVPPRAGLSRAVNFTKPTVHYFALPNVEQGRLWMAALMKATIDRDDTQPITTTYQQKTISLNKAKQMRHRPPALMNLEEAAEDDQRGPAATRPVNNGLGILGESDSGVSGLGKLVGVQSGSNGVSCQSPEVGGSTAALQQSA